MRPFVQPGIVQAPRVAFRNVACEESYVGLASFALGDDPTGADLMTTQAQGRIQQRNPKANDLLRVLPDREFARFTEGAEVVTLANGDVLFNHDEPSSVGYFPLNSVISTIALMKNGQEVEYGSIGREGMVGLQVALGLQPLRGRAICQLEGEVLRVPRSNLEELPVTAPRLQWLLMRYAQGTINVLAQSTACNALHSVRQRTARWLLMTRDRAGSDRFDLTQEFLSKMLGVRRAGVTEVALELQRAGIIDYARKQMEILDAQRLAEIACECYGLIRHEYGRVIDEAG
jgi:CRP-like cAMP-binding protein